jgi:hypothetical protein
MPWHGSRQMTRTPAHPARTPRILGGVAVQAPLIPAALSQDFSPADGFAVSLLTAFRLKSWNVCWSVQVLRRIAVCDETATPEVGEKS